MLLLDWGFLFYFSKVSLPHSSYVPCHDVADCCHIYDFYVGLTQMIWQFSLFFPILLYQTAAEIDSSLALKLFFQTLIKLSWS